MDQRKTRRVLDVQIYRLDSLLLISLLILLTLTGALMFILVYYIPTGSNGHFFVGVPCSPPQYKRVDCRKTFICYFQITSLNKWVQCITACRPWEGCETLSNTFNELFIHLIISIVYYSYQAEVAILKSHLCKVLVPEEQAEWSEGCKNQHRRDGFVQPRHRLKVKDVCYISRVICTRSTAVQYCQGIVRYSKEYLAELWV